MFANDVYSNMRKVAIKIGTSFSIILKSVNHYEIKKAKNQGRILIEREVVRMHGH
jgi:hypothetical protein